MLTTLFSYIPTRRTVTLLTLNSTLASQLLYAGSQAYIEMFDRAAGVRDAAITSTLRIAGYEPVRAPEAPPTPESLETIVNEEAARYHLNPSLLWAMITVESDGNPFAISSAGAAGLMQLMPATAKAYGVHPHERGNPRKNVSAGARFMGDLLKATKGDLATSLQRYNGGIGCVNVCKESISYARKVTDLLAEESTAIPSRRRPRPLAATSPKPPAGTQISPSK